MIGGTESTRNTFGGILGHTAPGSSASNLASLHFVDATKAAEFVSHVERREPFAFLKTSRASISCRLSGPCPATIFYVIQLT
jgi:hypothetical protein